MRCILKHFYNLFIGSVTTDMPLPQVSTSNSTLIPSNAEIGYYHDVGNLPPGAVLLSKNQIITKLVNQVEQWQPRSQVYVKLVGSKMVGLTLISQ